MIRVLNQKQAVDNLVVEFGRGEILVDLGKLAGIPAVFLFVANTPRPDLLGHQASPEEQVERTILSPGEVVLTFPTMEQARAVRDAITGGSADG
jgi:hypothetical protein